MYDIIPGILEKEWSEIERKINLVKDFTKVIHIDIIDGKFNPDVTFLDPKPFQKYTNAIFFELHMMVEDPIQYLKPYAAVGFKRFIGQIEKMPDQEEFVAQTKLFGEVGLAIDGPTPLEAIKVPHRDLDCVLIMTIKAGESGQKFDALHLEKIKILKSSKRTFLSGGGAVQDDNGGMPIIEVDGGINDVTIIEAKNAGAARFVSTSFIFNGQDSQAQFNLLKKCLE